MPTDIKTAKKLYDSINSGKKNYADLNEEGKRVYIQYRYDNGLLPLERANDKGKAYFAKYVNTKSLEYAPKAAGYKTETNLNEVESYKNTGVKDNNKLSPTYGKEIVIPQYAQKKVIANETAPYDRYAFVGAYDSETDPNKRMSANKLTPLPQATTPVKKQPIKPVRDGSLKVDPTAKANNLEVVKKELTGPQAKGAAITYGAVKTLLDPFNKLKKDDGKNNREIADLVEAQGWEQKGTKILTNPRNQQTGLSGSKVIQTKDGFLSAESVGNMIGSLGPYALTERAVATGLAKGGAVLGGKIGQALTKAAGSQVAKGALAGTAQQLTGDIAYQRDIDIKNYLVSAGLGALADIGLGALSKGLQGRVVKEGLTDAVKTDIKREVGQFTIDADGNVFKNGQFIRKTAKGGGGDVVSDEGRQFVDQYGNVKADSQPTQLLNAPLEPKGINNPAKGKAYAVKNTPLEQAQTEYDNAIKTIQDYFGTNQLRESEIPRIKSELGIDLNQLIRNLENAKPKDVRELSDNRYVQELNGLKPQINIRAKQPSVYDLAKGQRETPNSMTIAEARMLSPKPLQAPTPTRTNVLDTKPIEPIKPLKTPLNDNPLSKAARSFYSKTVDTQAELGRVSKDQVGIKSAKVMASNARNASSTTDHIINNELVGRDGRPLAKSLKETLTVPKAKESAFNEYLQNKHNIQRLDQGKPLLGYDVTKEMSQAKVAELESLNPEFKQKSDELNAWFKQFTREWGNDLVGSDLQDVLEKLYPNYVPGYRKTVASGGGFRSKGVTPGQIIKKAVGGEEEIIPVYQSIPALVSKMVKAQRKNEVYLALMDSIGKDNNLVKMADAKVGEAELIKDAIQTEGIDGIAGRNMLEADPMKGYFVTAMKNGKPQRMEVTEEIFKALKSLDNVDLSDTSKVFGWLKKNPVGLFKALVTGYNPIFAIKNIFRDIPTAYIQGSEHNPIKFMQNLGDAAVKMKNQDPLYKEYIAMGGKGGNFFNVEKGLNQGGKLSPIKDKIGAINNATETLPRFAEYLGTIKRIGNTYDGKMQALFNAAEVTVNFGRSGNVIKDIDTIVPYLNPSFQGLDKFFRTMRDPKKIIKAFGVSTAPAMLLYGINQAVAKDDYDMLDNRTKDTNYVIPIGDGKFFKVPKSREYGILFGSFFERLARTAQGKENPFKGYKTTLTTNIGPTNPVENNVFSPLILNIPKNKDFADRAIIPEYMLDDKRSPYLQFDEKTTEIAKALGKTLNMSPKQIDYLAKSYLGILATVGQPLNTKGGNVIKNTLERPFIADSLYNNDILNDLYEKRNELQRIKTDKNITQNVKSKLITPEEKKYTEFNKSVSNVSDLKKQINLLQQSNDPDKDQKIKNLQIQLLELSRKALVKQN